MAIAAGVAGPGEASAAGVTGVTVAAVSDCAGSAGAETAGAGDGTVAVGAGASIEAGGFATDGLAGTCCSCAPAMGVNAAATIAPSNKARQHERWKILRPMTHS
jgi:hypothetical protein